jgi:hypothetical protein
MKLTQIGNSGAAVRALLPASLAEPNLVRSIRSAFRRFRKMIERRSQRKRHLGAVTGSDSSLELGDRKPTVLGFGNVGASGALTALDIGEQEREGAGPESRAQGLTDGISVVGELPLLPPSRLVASVC